MENNEAFCILFFGILIFSMGIYVLFAYRNLLRIVLGVEIMAKGITLILLSAGVYQQQITLIQSLIITFIIVETVLAAVLLCLLIAAYRLYGSLDIRLLSKLKG
jgi:NADH:ubiquinone oxidoreductase subunit K